MPSATTRAIAGVLIVSGAVTAGILVSPTATMETVSRLADDPMLFSVVVAGLYLVRPLFAWPTTPLAIVVGYGYGVALGVPIALLGVAVTVVPVFAAVRWLRTADSGGDPADTSTGPQTASGAIGTLLSRTETAIDRYYDTAGPLRGVIVSRLAPIPSDVSTAAAAVSDVRLRHLLAGTLIGEFPWTVAGVIIGASAATATTDGLGDIGLALTIACTIAAAVLLAGPIYRVLQTRSAESGSAAEY